MLTSYHLLAKKSTIWLIAAVFLFSAIAPAQARDPNDPQYHKQESMWQQISAPQAWDYTTGSRQVVIADIDTGVDTWHADLAGNIWQNPYEVAGDGYDNDGNGYIDDVNGWNFVEDNSDVRISVIGGDADKLDKEVVSHGTVIAGLLGAVGDNGRAGVGVNWQVQIMPLRAMASDGSGTFEDVIGAVNYAVDNGADIISMSFVGEIKHSGLRNALYRAYEQGVVVVAAGGNDRLSGKGDLGIYPNYPICYDQSDAENWLVGVSSVNNADQLSYFADYGSCVDLVAPGQNIYSTERYAPQYGFNDEFGGGWKGTSFSAPLVAGAAGLIKAIHPDWQAKEIIAQLLSSADAIDSANPTLIGKLGQGRLNIGKAVKAAAQTPALDAGLSDWHYLSGNDLFKYDLKQDKKVFLTKIRDAKIVDFVYGDLNGDRKVEPGFLLQRDKYFFIHLLTSKGLFWREWSLPAKYFFGDASTESLRFYPAKQQIIVSAYQPKLQSSWFGVYSLTGELEREFSVAGKVSNWTVADSEARIIAAQMPKKNTLVVSSFDLSGQKIDSWQSTGVRSISTLASGKLWGGSEQAALIVESGKQWKQIIVDLPSGSSRQENIGPVGKSRVWHLQIGRVGQIMGLQRYRWENGLWPVYSGKGELLAANQLTGF